MGLFGKKRIIPRRKKKQEDIDRELARKEMLEESRKNPHLKMLWLKKYYPTLEIPKLQSQDAEEEAILRRSALENIRNNPVAMQRFTEAELVKLEARAGLAPYDGENGEEFVDEGGPSPSNPFRQVLMQLRDVEQVKELLGGRKKSGMLDGLADPAVLTTILAIVAKMMGANTPVPNGGHPEVRYVVTVEGQPISVTESDYKLLVAQGRMSPVGALAPPKTPATPLPLAPATPPAKEIPVETATGKPQVDPEDIKQLLALTPEKVVAELDRRVKANDMPAILVWNRATEMTAESVMADLESWRTNPVWGELIVTHALTPGRKEWVEKVLALVQSRQEAEDDDRRR